MQEPVSLNSWEEFRDWYYEYLVGRRWDRRHNEVLRRTRQSGEQAIHDGWRENMGYDAPWTDVMEFVDHGKAIGLGELKRSREQYPNWQRSAQMDLAKRAGLPLILIVAHGEDGPPFTVTVLYDPRIGSAHA